MTALTRSRMTNFERWTYKQFTLAVGNKAFKGGIAAIDMSTGKCEPGHVESDLYVIGRFEEDVDATLVEKLVNVDLSPEIEVVWWGNDAASPVTTAMLMATCFVLDDQTVSSDGSGRSIAGRVWAVDTLRGVAVQKISGPLTAIGSLDSLEAVPSALPAWSSNISALADNPNSNATYDAPTTAAASIVTLPAVATDGTLLYFTADGVKNAHTIQYRDATGLVNLTTALTALKRHLVIALRRGSIWVANAYVSP